MASYRFPDQVRDSSPSRQGLSKSQMCLHKILRIIASSAPLPLPPAGEATASSNQGSSSPSSARPEVESETDLSYVNRGIGIDLNTEFSPGVLGGRGEVNGAVSAGSVAEDDNKALAISSPPAVAVKAGKQEEEEDFAGSGESAAVVDQKSSEGEFDPISKKDGGDCSPPAEALEATDPRINESQEIGINRIVDEDDDKKGVEEEGKEVRNDSRRADEGIRAVEEVGGGERNHSDQDKIVTADRRLTVLIEAAELASGNDSSLTTAGETEEEEESEPHSPSLRGRGGRIALRGAKRRNKCWVVDLYRDNGEMRAATATVAGSESKRGRRRSQVLPSRYRDSSVVMEPWKPLSRRRS